jgi:hypothetical protein
MSPRTSIIALTLALCACGGGGGGAGGGAPASASLVVTSPPVAAPAASAVGGCTVGFWGDSIAALTAPRLASTLQVDLHAVVGGTAQAAEATMLQDALAERFQVIEYGTNDANSGSPLQAPVLAMIARAESLGRTVVLTGISHEIAGAVDVEANYSLWESTLGTLYANWPGVQFNGLSDLMPDGVHPEAEYAQRLADALSTIILEHCTP